MTENTKRYLSVFIITAVIFVFALWLSSQLSGQKINELKDLENQISLNILSTETRYSLLEKTSCEFVLDSPDNQIGLNTELNDLARRLKFMESQLGTNNRDVIDINRYYALLQIKDYLLVQELHSRCNEKIVSILYFHKTDCTDCAKQSIILDKVANDYPEIRVYWLDKDTDTPALKTLTSLFKITDAPALVINEKTFQGLQSYDQIESYIPEIKQWQKDHAAKEIGATTTATSSKK